MTEDHTLAEQINNAIPRVRMIAARRLLQEPEAIGTTELIRILQSESVHRIRRILEEVVEKRTVVRELAEGRQAPKSSSDSSEHGNIRHVLATVRHELNPIIGRIRLAASDEIPDFQSSETNKEVENLRVTLRGLDSLLLGQTSEPIEELILPDELCRNWPRELGDPNVASEYVGTPPIIRVDAGLFRVMLENIYQNCVDVSPSSGDSRVKVQWGATNSEFWFVVSNRFDGESFSRAEVVETGKSSKASHDGRGVKLIEKICDRLEFVHDIEASSGIATAMIRGKVSNAKV